MHIKAKQIHITPDLYQHEKDDMLEQIHPADRNTMHSLHTKLHKTHYRKYKLHDVEQFPIMIAANMLIQLLLADLIHHSMSHYSSTSPTQTADDSTWT